MNSDYININKKSWNDRTSIHVNSDFYDVPGFLTGTSSLNEIELELLGKIQDKSLLHLQCHFGMDSISLARMGAKVTGIDFSDKAIEEAKLLSHKTGNQVDFVCSDVYSLKLDKIFDIIFTSYGVIGWLPDLSLWAQTISKHLKPGGKFVFVEFHPVVWMFDNGFSKIEYNYFKDGEIQESESGTYAKRDSDLQLQTVTWNHSLSEVIGSLLSVGLEIETFREYDYSPYNCFQGMQELTKGKFIIEKLGNKIPMIYALSAKKN
ncbi:MAG: class I SAM-dependent methyltransferase [Bacteroidia bacterium]|nr:class I SAM-dependent methyltransferase [Bacteroidia bacterium]